MEMVLSNGFCELTELDELLVDGGVSVAGIVCSACGIVAGAATVVGGVCLLLTPEPTGLTKIGGWSAITAGASTIVGGAAGVAWACGY